MLFIILILIDQMGYAFQEANYNPLEMCIVIKQIKCKSSGMNITRFFYFACYNASQLRRRADVIRVHVCIAVFDVKTLKASKGCKTCANK